MGKARLIFQKDAVVLKFQNKAKKLYFDCVQLIKRIFDDSFDDTFN